MPVPVTRIKSQTATLPVSLKAAKNHLRVMTPYVDDQVASALAAAVDYAEGWLNRSLRTETVVVEQFATFPTVMRAEINPVVSVDDVRYVDRDGYTNSLSSDEYSVTESTDGMTVVAIAPTSSPQLAPRYDAVQVEYTAGYPSELPAHANQAVLMLTSLYFNNLDERQAETVKKRSRELLSMAYPGNYR